MKMMKMKIEKILATWVLLYKDWEIINNNEDMIHTIKIRSQIITYSGCKFLIQLIINKILPQTYFNNRNHLTKRLIQNRDPLREMSGSKVSARRVI